MKVVYNIKLCFLTIILLLLVLLSCTHQTKREDVEKYIWKYADGYYIGDIIYFNKDSIFILDKNLAILKNRKQLGCVIKINKEMLLIKSLEGKEGTYVVFQNIYSSN